MSAIFGLHVGQCGSQIGHQFWKQISEEHKILSQQPLGRLLCFYEKQHKYETNSLFVDMESSAHQPIWAQKSQIHNQNNTIIQHSPSQMLFSEAYYKSGVQLKQKTLSQLRKRIQLLQAAPDIILSCGMGGGTGSGISASLLCGIDQQYRPLIHSNMVLPNLKTCHMTDIYNTVLGLHHFVQNSTMCTLFQNKAAQKIVHANYSKNIIKYEDIDKIYAHAIKQITSGFRFPGSLNSSYRKLATNLIPFPRIHFFTQSISSINKHKNRDSLQQVLLPKNFLGFMQGTQVQRHYVMGICCRDPYAYQQEINQNISNFMLSNTEWIPDYSHLNICDTYNFTNRSSATIIVNSAAHINYIKQLGESFTAAFRRKAFLYHYTSGCMDQMEFTQAQSNLNDLLSEYQPYSCYTYEQQQQFRQQ